MSNVKKAFVHQDMAHRDLLYPCGQFLTGGEVVAVTPGEEGERQWLGYQLVPRGWSNERRQRFCWWELPASLVPRLHHGLRAAVSGIRAANAGQRGLLITPWEAQERSQCLPALQRVRARLRSRRGALVSWVLCTEFLVTYQWMN